ncbi:protein FAM169B [Aulostomus maculatus]
MYPSDLPALDGGDLTSASEEYLSSLESRPHDDEWFQSSQASKVAVTANNINRLQLFEDEQCECTVLALHPPGRPSHVVALYLHGRWWCLDDVLRTSSKSRIGLVSVQSILERVIVFLLSQVVDRPSQEEVLFSPHPSTESCKLLWKDSQAVGFYTVKHKGSLCDNWSNQCYLLPVLDTMLVRRSWRRRGFGLQMLDDFCCSFTSEEVLGISAPLSASMVAVCRRFLQLHEDHRDNLYEVEAPGGWTQRRNIWLNIQLRRYSLGFNKNNPAQGSTGRNEGHESSKMVKTSEPHVLETSKQDMASPNTCKVTLPPVIGSYEQQIEPCDPSQGGSSLTSSKTGSGCSLTPQAHDPDPRSPTRSPGSIRTPPAMRSKPSLTTDPRREKPEQTQRITKRTKRT